MGILQYLILYLGILKLGSINRVHLSNEYDVDLVSPVVIYMFPLYLRTPPAPAVSPPRGISKFADKVLGYLLYLCQSEGVMARVMVGAVPARVVEDRSRVGAFEVTATYCHPKFGKLNRVIFSKINSQNPLPASGRRGFDF